MHIGKEIDVTKQCRKKVFKDKIKNEMRNFSKSSANKKIEKSHSFQIKTKGLSSESKLGDIEEASEEM
jgi:hypothetical protein